MGNPTRCNADIVTASDSDAEYIVFLDSRIVLENDFYRLVDVGFAVRWISSTCDIDDENLPCPITAPIEQPRFLRSYILNIIYLLNEPNVLQ